METRNIDDIRVGARRRKDLGDIDALAESIARLGLLQPIVVRSDNSLVAGERRLTAHRKLGLDRITVHVADGLEDELRFLEAERDENTCRKPLAPSELVDTARRIEALALTQSRANQKASRFRGREPGGSPIIGPGNFPAPKQQTRDRIAAALGGISGRTLEKARRIVDAAEADPARYGRLVEEMDRTGRVDGVYRRLRRMEQLTSTRVLSRSRDVAPTLRLIHGEAVEVMASIEDASVDLVFADPPYNIGVRYSTEYRDSMPEDVYFEWCRRWFTEVSRILKITGSFYVMNYPEVCARWKPMLDELLTFRNWITWCYPTNTGHAQGHWTRASRAILFYTRSDSYTFNGLADAQPFRNPEDKRIKRLIEEGQPGVTPYDWWEHDVVKNVSGEKTHWANQVPLALVERIVKTSSNPGDVVLDPFLGSGTTAVAAHRNGRSFIGVDRIEDAIHITRARLMPADAGDRPPPCLGLQ
jgi:DNA modification methylase